MLGYGQALTIDAAQGITSDEHINALPRGTSGVTAFTSYTAESRARGATWTVISEAALLEAERHRQAMGDITPIATEDLYARAAADMSRKDYKRLGIDLLAAARRDREDAVDAFIKTNHALETAELNNPDFARDAAARLRAQAINEQLAKQLTGLDGALQRNAAQMQQTLQSMDAAQHLRALQAEARRAKGRLDTAAQIKTADSSLSSGPEI